MTQQLPPPTYAERLARRALVKNLIGLLLLLTAGVGLTVVAFVVDMRLGFAVAFAAEGGIGFFLATSED